MRQFFKWLLCLFFWISFASSLAVIIYNFAFIHNYYNLSFIVGCFVVAISFVLGIVSMGEKLTMTSPILGRKILHDTGIYYVDYKIDRFGSEIRTNIYIYKDQIVRKKVLSSSVVFNPSNEEEIIKEINKCLTGIQKEFEAKTDIKSLKNKSLNLLSIEAKRENKFKSIFE